MTSRAANDENYYKAILEELRNELCSSLPSVEEEARAKLTADCDIKTRVQIVQKLCRVREFLTSDAVDTRLAKFLVLHEATPAGLAAFCQKGSSQTNAIETLLGDDRLMLQMARADGARPVHSQGNKPARYGEAMQLYQKILESQPSIATESDSDEGSILQRLALSVALEYSESENAIEEGLQRFLHFQQAHQDGELDPYFFQLTTWELRFVVCAPESNDTLLWGRKMLRNFRPDHISTTNLGWRYANVVTTDVAYGSGRVRNDRPELSNPQNILMNGGICGRRANFARFICRAFGIPATPRPSKGHGASARWTPAGWAVVLGPGWGSGRSTTRYPTDLDFLASSQAHRSEEFLECRRAFWMGDVLGETRDFREAGHTQGLWNAIGIATRRKVIEDSKAVTLDALGVKLGEANGTCSPGSNSAAVPSEEIGIADDGTVTIPAASFEGTPEDVTTMRSHGSGAGSQVYLPAFSQQRPILCRGGSFRHDASLCQSATRHWRGRRPKKSKDLRGLRLAMTLDDSEEENPKELTLEIAKGVKMEFVLIPAGSFVMGGHRDKKEGDVLADTPRHEVTLSRSFYLGKYPVTNAQYQGVMEPNKKCNPTKDAQHPASGVKPNNGLNICEKISSYTGHGARLPTEAEWEYAARAGTSSLFYFGDDPGQLGEHAWYKDNAGNTTHPVGQKQPNPWGLYDIYGNVCEFVRDEHIEDYYANSPRVDPTGPSLGTFSEMEYYVDVTCSGDYALTAIIVTNNPEQQLQVSVNGGAAQILTMPFTLGSWHTTDSLTVPLQSGKNKFRFWREKAPQYAIALKSFTLQPTA